MSSPSLLNSAQLQSQPMLSRVADSLYWMSRYLERMEHTARVLDVNLNQMLEQTPEAANRRWERMLASLRVPQPHTRRDDRALMRSLTFDQHNKASILHCVGSARENARQVREHISSEMWQQLNQLYLEIRRASKSRSWGTQPHQFFQQVKEGGHLLQGITDSTMTHDEGWQFIQVGRSIERASSIATLLDVHYQDSNNLDYFAWVGLLRCCTGFEAYCRFYTADIKPAYVMEFLLLNTQFPHSISFSARMLQQELQTIAQSAGGGRQVGKLERLAGRLRASLDYGHIDEILLDMHSYLNNIQQQCGEIHNAIQQVYISYPVGSVINS